MDFKKDYYAILGLNKASTAEEIKKAYRRLAKKYHPDLNPNDPESEERIKAINEAYEVLGSSDNRFVYDHYKESEPSAEERATPEAEQPPKAKPGPNTKNQRTYTRKEVFTTEEKIYVKGTIFIKYRGEQDNDASDDILKEVVYNLHLTDVRAIIYTENIYKELDTPASFHQAIAGKKQDLNIRQPIRTKVISASGESHYELEIFDLTVPNLVYDNVTKEDGQSFGSLHGEFFGYIKHVEIQEKETSVTECYGESGRTEHKTENGINYHRKEYFKSDCTLYWGNWIAAYVEPVRTPEPIVMASNGGCLPSLMSGFQWSVLIIFLVYFLARLSIFLPFLLIAGLFWLISARLWSWFFRVGGLVLLGLFIFSFINAFYYAPRVLPVTVDRPQERRPERTPVRNSRSDSLITYFRSWKDYDGQQYEGKYSIRKSAFNSAKDYKNGLDILGNDEQGYDEMLYRLAENDKNCMGGLYKLLDALNSKNNLSPERFAEMTVAMVQDIPYAVVLPNACDANLYADQFTSKYLATPNAKCDGYEKFGINTPVEFLATLNGDCDTRTLLLYTILAHYGYDVALLSSEFYGHSIIGINLPIDGVTYNYQDKKYTLWETTSFIKPGILPNEVADLDHWRISLTSKP